MKKSEFACQKKKRRTWDRKPKRVDIANYLQSLQKYTLSMERNVKDWTNKTHRRQLDHTLTHLINTPIRQHKTEPPIWVIANFCNDLPPITLCLCLGIVTEDGKYRWQACQFFFSTGGWGLKGFIESLGKIWQTTLVTLRWHPIFFCLLNVDDFWSGYDLNSNWYDTMYKYNNFLEIKTIWDPIIYRIIGFIMAATTPSQKKNNIYKLNENNAVTAWSL